MSAAPTSSSAAAAAADTSGTDSAAAGTDSTLVDVQAYYGETLGASEDLLTNACTTGGDMPAYVKKALANVHDEVLAKYYGCGLIIPTTLKGMRVLDLGSGSGRDCYVLSQLVGEDGYVLGVDMTDAQLEVANRHVEWHAEKFGYSKPNTEFRKGFIEKLGELGLEDSSFDIVVSNCVINLSPDKDSVLREVFRVLKPGGELYFSDVYSDRRIPQHLRENKVLWGECISGALYWNDFVNLGKKHGFDDPRLVGDSVITVNNAKLEPLVAAYKFFSATYRLFKLPGLLEPACEDYGQAVIYRGTIEEMPDTFVLDGHHRIEKGRVFPVCGNTYNMLKETRLAPHFEFIGNFSTHFGIFADCGTPLPFESATASGGDGGTSGGCC